jgi:hypothetical protein
MVFCVQWVQLRLEMIVRFADICGNYDHRCLKFLFINWFIILNTSRSFPHSRFITGVVARLARRVLLVEQELPTLPGHLSSPPVYSGVRVTQSLVFVDRYQFFCPFSIGHCVFCSTSINGLWLPLWYLQTLLKAI